MNKYWFLFKKNLGLNLSTYFAYPKSVFIMLISDLFGIIIQPLLIFFIYDVSNGLPGWTFYELLVFNATGLISISIAGSSFMSIIWRVGHKVDRGNFDHDLVKPMKMTPFLLLSSFNPWWTADFITGLSLFIIGVFKGGLSFTLVNTLVFVYLIILASMIFFCCGALIVYLSFKYFKAYMIERLFWILKGLDEYPLNIYTGFIPFFLTFVFPIAIANYYPASFLMGKLTDYTILIPISLIAFTLLFIGLKALKNGVKYYTSGGG